MKKNSKQLLEGLRDGLPIALGYFAVSFSLGIQARDAGMNVVQAAAMSFSNFTSAGEFAALTIISSGGSFISMALSQLIINLRYILMSFALSQRIAPETSTIHRMAMSFGITDEIFGVSVGRKPPLSPFYTYGALLLTVPGWAGGTAAGVAAGSILPDNIVNALNIALYSMFIAVFIPASRDDRHVGIAVIISMAASWLFSLLPVIKDISQGTRVIILTVCISLLFAIIFPVDENKNTEEASS